jgi:hypothetical protein
MSRWFDWARRPKKPKIEPDDLTRDGFLATEEQPPTRKQLEDAGLLRTVEESTPDRSGVDTDSDADIALVGSLAARRRGLSRR